jgi:hypothetical protein
MRDLQSMENLHWQIESVGNLLESPQGGGYKETVEYLLDRGHEISVRCFVIFDKFGLVLERGSESLTRQI